MLCQAIQEIWKPVGSFRDNLKFRKKGSSDRPLTEADIKEIYKMRALIEPQICMEYAQFYSRSKLFDYVDKFDADYDRSDWQLVAENLETGADGSVTVKNLHLGFSLI